MVSAEQVALLPDNCSTRDVARVLGLAVRSVQLMVDRGELLAWKTPGGHRRIARASVQRWLERNQPAHAAPAVVPKAAAFSVPVASGLRVLLIEDSRHIQNLVRCLLGHYFPQIELYVADDAIVGLVMAGQLCPQVVLVDIVLPGVDGSTLVRRWHAHPPLLGSQLVVLTGLDTEQRAAYAFALAGVPVVYKPQLAQQLPTVLLACLQGAGTAL
jgi:excisionase family DNA binding protein